MSDLDTQLDDESIGEFECEHCRDHGEIDGEACQECCTHDDRENGHCIDCGHVKSGE